MAKPKKLKKNMSIDDLAVMVAQGFENTATKDDIARLDQGLEEVKLRLDGVAYRFELAELQKRIQLLEKRVGISR
ncbi:MAG: hypothetical protein COT92_02870 [Candidatus Doudnabacteria bacterium CG10_big_fil_rev_8_21_14_0_10_42_18]|uniref:Uncharacterized protein n=1 Tax=Candidatus Doudnabacteria bacterium CG10_big_fil_rev_8_21_14_0_10_42_18 TaxID=1974552 RepID=A0A2H0VAK8_9BACT|nr:MAG: hypothetical protein COT92_02870 [Candidatus Doudnabacteria bacterium CG10_big_fil_rev_8_21_14_0_10_42_18]